MFPSQDPHRSAHRAKLAVLVNTIAPYRLPIYASLAERFEMLLLHGGREANRTWSLTLPESLRAEKVWTIQVPMRKQTGIAGVWDTQYLHVPAGLLWWLPKFAPDAILTNELGLRTWIALLYGRLARVPVWVQWEGSLHSEQHIMPFKRVLRLRLAKVIQHWISYGAASTEYLLSLGVKPERLAEVQNCVPHEIFLDQGHAPADLFVGDPRPLLLSVGQLIPRKGFHTLIDACGRLASRGKEFTLVLVGAGPEQQRLEEQAKRVGLRHFHILPNQSQAALSSLYKAASAFVFPTLEDVWGLVVSEAMWAGTPVLCSKYAGSAEIVAAENLFDPTSEVSFDDGLERIFRGELRFESGNALMTCGQVGDAIVRSISEHLDRGEMSPAPRAAAPGL